MRIAFHPRLVNSPFDDPGLFVPFILQKQAVQFDLGDIYSLSSRDILKISHAFVSHTHMDHFAGFDRLLRLCLGREKAFCLYGPPGFLKNLEGKLSAYTWNLVDNYTDRFRIQASEVHPDHLLTQTYICSRRFIPQNPAVSTAFNGLLLEEPAFSVYAEILDHNTPCLGFRMEERFHINIIREKLESLDLNVGPWLSRFKQALYDELPPDTSFDVEAGGNVRRFRLGELAGRIATLTPGQKIAYVTDSGYTPGNIEKILKLAQDADHLFIEAAFLEADRDTAREKYHLTAWQAGTLAGRAGAKQFTIFHFSPRYTDMDHLIREEAQQAFLAANAEKQG